MSDSDSKSLENLNRTGRKKGSKNKSTLVREALRGEWDDLLLSEGVKVFQAVVEKAKGDILLDKDGSPIKNPETGEYLRTGADMTAAKLILERVIPAQENKMAGKIQIGEGGLQIFIEKLEAQPAPTPAIDGEVEEAEYEEVAQ